MPLKSLNFWDRIGTQSDKIRGSGYNLGRAEVLFSWWY